MIRRWLTGFFLALVFTGAALAHVGSPDVFYEGMAGPYPARITIRMPAVVPGRAEISVRVPSDAPVTVSIFPLYWETKATNAPPADVARLVRGETNLYSGELWLMSFGAYSIQVKVHGPAGEGSVEIPVNSVATSQLPLPPYLGNILLALGVLLFVGGLAIVMGAARDSVLMPGASAGKCERRKGWIAGAVTFVIFALLLVGGRRWWNAEETEFRRHLRGGGWPDLTTVARVEGSQRILTLTLGKTAFEKEKSFTLIPDHGKLLHFFLIRDGTEDVFAHLHPVRKKDETFEVALPPMPAGRYRVFCDLTLEKSGLSSTATNSVLLPAMPRMKTTAVTLEPDADDSWASYAAKSVPAANGTNLVYQLPSGERVVWQAHAPLRVRQDAGLRFEVWDAAGNPTELEPYMGMMSHAAVMRTDGAVFAHLHPSGNYSMASQGYFQSKLAREAGSAAGRAGEMSAGMDHAQMGHLMDTAVKCGVSVISLPYEFPTAGDYRIWVQFKTKGKILTAVFDATVR